MGEKTQSCFGLGVLVTSLSILGFLGKTWKTKWIQSFNKQLPLNITHNPQKP